jgi:hypothetical protein
MRGGLYSRILTIVRAMSLVRLVLMSTLAAACAVAGARELEAQAGLRERTIFVSAVDGRGDPVAGLGPADFVIQEDGRAREVLRVTPATEAIDIALLIDTSASAERAIASIRDGVRRFTAQMAVGNQIAIVGLADRPTILADYSSSEERLAQGIGRLFAMNGSGMTLLDAIVEVSAGLRRREAPRAVIVPVMTNGVEFTNRYARDVIAAVRAAGAGLHAIVVGHLPVLSTEDRERAITLDAGARDTGGQHVTLLTESAIESALLRLARELTSQYKVVYGRPESLIPPDRIEVRPAKPGVTMRGTPMRGQAGA